MGMLRAVIFAAVVGSVVATDLLTKKDVDNNLRKLEDTDTSLLEGTLVSNLITLLSPGSFGDVWDGIKGSALFVLSMKVQFLSSIAFEANNFVDGFRENDLEEVEGCSWWKRLTRNCPMVPKPKWRAPVKGEKVGVVSFYTFVKEELGKDFADDHEFFKRYFTGRKVPSWEDNEVHQGLQRQLDTGMSVARTFGFEPMNFIRAMDLRFSFDNEAPVEAGWKGFPYLKAREIKYASNGVFGIDLVDKANTADTLGLLMTETVFSAHLSYDSATSTYSIDVSSLAKYKPLPEYSPLGGKAFFKKTANGKALTTVRIEYGGKAYTRFDDAEVEAAFKQSKLIGWRYAEKCVIASLVAMTNLVMHVKNLHLELAAGLQAVTIDGFAQDVAHPVRRMLDPFIHRSIQATNDNFKLLFDYRASEFSLAPLLNEEQMKLIADAVRDAPLNLADFDMERYGTANGRNMPAADSEESGFWVWGYRTKTVQRLYEDMVTCYLNQNGMTDAQMKQDAVLQGWWKEMQKAVPAVAKAVRETPEWASETLDRKTLINVGKTLMVWLSWVHEDVGHSAAAFVYNPVHTPMAVPKDGVGIPYAMHMFNVAAYRSFVFLERTKLMGTTPEHWFSATAGDFTCYSNFQRQLNKLDSKPQFAKCDENGYYSCINRVETAVSS